MQHVYTKLILSSNDGSESRNIYNSYGQKLKQIVLHVKLSSWVRGHGERVSNCCLTQQFFSYIMAITS